jgi:uncharacterized repeat protein (TIGR03803 family)
VLGNKISVVLKSMLVFTAVSLLITSTRVAAQQGKAIHSFAGTDGSSPQGGLIFDAVGNLYGTTIAGGANQVGTVFEMAPLAGGSWAERVLYSFLYNGQDGYDPRGGVILDAAGNFYGTTVSGGAYGYGSVFELTPSGRTWVEKLLYSFVSNDKDGVQPAAGLILDPAGNLYGTTCSGGAFGSGTVFELSPAKSGGWGERVLHSFSNNAKDGGCPSSGLVRDPAGNLYGTTYSGGQYSVGTVFQLYKASGAWREHVLYSFNWHANGVDSPVGLTMDTAGNLFISASNGGTYREGAICELSPSAGGSWTEKVILVFDGSNGSYPDVSLILDAASNLFGTTSGGVGNVFELAPAADGTWTQTVLYSFPSDSSEPSGVILDAAGNLYGETMLNGAYNGGSVFEVTP